MNASNEFKKVIQAYLDQRAKEDEQFAQSYAKPEKNIDDCCTYILNTVKNSRTTMRTNEEVFSMAVHYYDEDNIKPGKAITLNKIVMTSEEPITPVELTPEEKEEARLAAIKRAEEEQYRKITKKRPKSNKAAGDVQQMTLF